MNKAKVKDMRVQITKVLSDLSEYSDYTLKLGNISFSSTGFRGTIICEEMSTDDGCKHPARFKADWDEAVSMKIVKATDFGVVTGVGSKRYKVVGFDFKRKKLNIILEKLDDGKIYNASMNHFNQREFNVKGEKRGLHIVQ